MFDKIFRFIYRQIPFDHSSPDNIKQTQYDEGINLIVKTGDPLLRNLRVNDANKRRKFYLSRGFSFSSGQRMSHIALKPISH